MCECAKSDFDSASPDGASGTMIRDGLRAGTKHRTPSAEIVSVGAALSSLPSSACGAQSPRSTIGRAAKCRVSRHVAHQWTGRHLGGTDRSP